MVHDENVGWWVSISAALLIAGSLFMSAWQDECWEATRFCPCGGIFGVIFYQPSFSLLLVLIPLLLLLLVRFLHANMFVISGHE